MRRDPSEWNSLAAVREASAGAFQALAVMVCFVLFGLGWAVLADASQSAVRLPEASVGSHATRLASDSLTRYRSETDITSPAQREEVEVRHAQIERQTYAQLREPGYRP